MSRDFTVTVNARNGTVAEDIVRSQLKRDLREDGHLRMAGWRQFDIAGWQRPDADLPNSAVTFREVTLRDRLPTYVVTFTLYRDWSEAPPRG